MAALLALLLSVVAVAQACNIPPGGCDVKKVCAAADGVRAKGINQANFRSYPMMGFFKGLYNSQNGKFKINEKGGGPLNYEIFTEVGKTVKLVSGSAGNTLGKCCTACAETSGCFMYQFFESSSASVNKKVPGFVNGVQCYLLQRQAGSGDYFTPASGHKTVQHANMLAGVPFSWLGGLCNGAPDVVNDPHLVGAQGTPFDFTGALDTSYCLLSDARLHINILLRGYGSDGPAMAKMGESSLHTWIKEIGLIWTAEDGSRHTLRMVARAGKSVARENGFMSAVEIDGQAVAVPAYAGDAIVGNGDVTLTKVAEQKEGRSTMDVDDFVVEIKGLATLNLRMRPAHPLLQTPTDAQIHFNMQLTNVQTTPAVHGVLGQTFRQTEDRVERALKYSHLSSLLGHPVAADKAEGAGFLDGSAGDYASSSVVAPDCKFSAFSA